MNRKTNDSYYQHLRDLYLLAISVIHDLEVAQANRRVELKTASDQETRSLLRWEMYKGRKQLSRLNKDIVAYYNYRSDNNIHPWE